MTKMDIKKIEKYFIFFLYLALFCALVIYSVKYYHNLVENVKNMEFFSLFVIFLIQIIILYLCSIRLYLLLDPLNKIKINVNSLFLIFNASSIFKYVPPKGVNYYMRIKFLDKINNIHGKITSSFGEFVIDLYASAICALILVFVFLDNFLYLIITLSFIFILTWFMIYPRIVSKIVFFLKIKFGKLKKLLFYFNCLTSDKKFYIALFMTFPMMFSHGVGLYLNILHDGKWTKSVSKVLGTSCLLQEA